jgi:hypothetical protein
VPPPPTLKPEPNEKRRIVQEAQSAAAGMEIARSTRVDRIVKRIIRIGSPSFCKCEDVDLGTKRLYVGN